MAIRTTDEDVAAIIEVEEGKSLTPFIAAASALVDRVQAAAEEEGLMEPVNSGDPTREELLAQIETWLAAHFYAIYDPRPTQEMAGTVSATYQSKVDLHLNVTHYGQMALVLDITGTLRDLSNGTKRKAMRVIWLGTESDQ